MEFILTGNPQSTNHIYRHNGNRVYMTPAGKSLKTDYQWQFKSQHKKKPIEGDVDLRIELFFGDKRIRDIDNYNKILLDAASNIVWLDDAQIQSLLIVKNYDKKNPRIVMTIN